jgi:GT2 family glycosyltransferase
LAIDYPNYRIVICDNGSEDGSCARIAEWADQNRQILRNLSKTTVDDYREIDLGEIEQVGLCESFVTLVRNGSNLGFAGGNNSGLRYALNQPDCAFVWLLNNDTVVDSAALSALVSVFDERSSTGLCGSRLVFYHDRARLQAFGGGTYSPWFGLATHVGEFTSAERVEALSSTSIEYPCAASVLVSRPFLEVVGLMSEDYFLYFEELDWVRRAKKRFEVAVAPDSIVYHKEGQSIGSDGKAAQRSPLSDYYLTRSRFIFTRKYHWYALPTLFLWLAGMLAVRVKRYGVRGGFARTGLVLRAAFDGLLGKRGAVAASRIKVGRSDA